MRPPQVPAIGAGVPRLLRLASDERLIALVRRGDDRAFEALVQRYEPRLTAFCRQTLRSREDAEDVMQDVLARAYRGIRAHERDIAARPWLYRIARNCCLDHLGRAKPDAQAPIDELEIEGSGGSAGDEAGRREQVRQLMADLRELPETQRTALAMRELGGLSYDQVAEAMDTTVPAVKSLLVRGRMSLAEASEARGLACHDVHAEFDRQAAGGSRASGAARRHARSCGLCGAYRRRWAGAAALVLPLLPLSLLRRIADIVGFDSGASAAGGGTGGTAMGAKLAAGIATAAIATAAPHVAPHRAVHHPERAAATPAVPATPVIARSVPAPAPAAVAAPVTRAPAAAAKPVAPAGTPAPDPAAPGAGDPVGQDVAAATGGSGVAQPGTPGTPGDPAVGGAPAQPQSEGQPADQGRSPASPVPPAAATSAGFVEAARYPQTAP